jgi:hypothetical protein
VQDGRGSWKPWLLESIPISSMKLSKIPGRIPLEDSLSTNGQRIELWSRRTRCAQGRQGTASRELAKGNLGSI